MKMKIYQCEVAPIGTNCYLVVNEEKQEAVVVDPGGSPEIIAQMIEKSQAKVVAIFLTHGHMDHIGALEQVQAETGAKVYVSKEDASMLSNPTSSLAAFFGTELHCPKPDVYYGQGDEIEAAGLIFQVLATPGHTPGGVCLLCGGYCFCGDSIFCESIGRTDFPGGSYEDLIRNIKEKILILPPETKLLPGHGPSTTVEWERKRNPFLQ